jgi:hypothetical protein
LERKTAEALVDACGLMEKATVYARNTGTRITPSTPRESRQPNTPYRYSPFGQELQISDYSPFVSPVRTPRRKG